MILSALVTRCASRYRDLGSAVVNTAGWENYLNDAYADVIAASPLWPFLNSSFDAVLAAGQSSVELPPDVFRVSAAFNATDDILLTPITDTSSFLDRFPNPNEDRGVPEFYRMQGTFLQVYPWPAVPTAIALEVYSPPAPLTSADEPAFPEQYHRMLVAAALAYAYEDDGNLKQSQAHGATFARLLGDMKNDLMSPRTPKYPTILDDF